MAKLSRDQRMYNMGMEHALSVAKRLGMEELEKEVRHRSSNPMPLNISKAELTAAVRMGAKNEIEVIATAMADTITNHLAFPPSMVIEYLRQFNKKIDEFRDDPVALEKAKMQLNRDYGMNSICEKFIKEDMEKEKENENEQR